MKVHEEWNGKSRAVAFVKDDNLFVTDAEGKAEQLPTEVITSYMDRAYTATSSVSTKNILE